MLSVLPIQSKDEQKEVCELCRVEYRPTLLAYKLTDGGKTVGVCQFRLTPEGGVISTLSGLPGEEKFEYLFMLGRGTLNFIDTCGAKYAYLDIDGFDDVTARAIGFSRIDGRYRIDLEGFFTEPCKHH